MSMYLGGECKSAGQQVQNRYLKCLFFTTIYYFCVKTVFIVIYGHFQNKCCFNVFDKKSIVRGQLKFHRVKNMDNQYSILHELRCYVNKLLKARFLCFVTLLSRFTDWCTLVLTHNLFVYDYNIMIKYGDNTP